MVKLTKYLKPFWVSVVFVVVFIYAQVQAQLALPDAMSAIVTNGIQFSGITDTEVLYMSESTMDKVLLLMDEKDQDLVKEGYDLISQGDNSFVEEYPILESEGVYLLKEGYDLDETISKPFMVALMLSTDDAIKTMEEKLDLPEGVDIWTVLSMAPDAKDQIFEYVDIQMGGLLGDNIDSAVKMGIKSEYTKVGIDVGAIQMNYIINEGLVMLAISLGNAICAIVVAFLSSRIAAGLARNLRREVFTKVEHFSSTEFSKFSTASLITRTTNDVQNVQQAITMIMRIALFAPLMGIGALIRVWNYPSMLGTIFMILVVITLLIGVTFFIAMPKFKKHQKLVDRVNLVVREILSGMMVIRAFGTEQHEKENFEVANSDLRNVSLFVNRVMSFIMPAMGFVMSASSVLIVWVCANQIDVGAMQIGDMLAFIQYAMNILMSFLMVAMISMVLPQASVSAERLLEVLDSENSINDPKQPKKLPEGHGKIVFDHVSFKYPNAQENVLENVNFEVNPGETVALIGSTGSGKSTLINLIPRFFDVSEGSIRLNGIDIRDITLHDLRNQIGYVPQKGVLFSGTIESNLKYADENASDEVIEEAIKVSQSKEFIDSKEEGLNTDISQGGTNVSGGQKQRLSIARALVKQANIYIFDDSFSALDFKTERTLREQLNEMIAKTKSTVFIVAQRISTIVNADKIIVLDNGKVVGMGKHDELMKNCDVYKEIALSQLSKEELAHE